MYEIDPKFRNEDGSINIEAARAAGRRQRAQAAGEGFRYLRAVAGRMVSQTKALTSRLVEYVSSAAFFGGLSARR